MTPALHDFMECAIKKYVMAILISFSTGKFWNFPVEKGIRGQSESVEILAYVA